MANESNLPALASHMEALPPILYDQARPVHANGSPACLLAHMAAFFGDDVNPHDPRAIRESAETILGIEYGMAACLYHGFPFGRDSKGPTTREAGALLRRVADDKGATWIRDGR